MFHYGTDKTCKFFPHTTLKDQNLFDVIVRDPTSVGSIYILQCSTPYENVLKNNDPYSQSYEGHYLNFKFNRSSVYLKVTYQSLFLTHTPTLVTYIMFMATPPQATALNDQCFKGILIEKNDSRVILD